MHLFFSARCTVRQTPIIFISIFLYSQMYHLLNPHLFFSGRCTILILLNKSLLLGRCTIRQTPIFFLCIFICGRCTICHLYFSYASFFWRCTIHQIVVNHVSDSLRGQKFFFFFFFLFFFFFFSGRCTVRQTPIIFILIFSSLQMYHSSNPYLFYMKMYRLLNPHLFFQEDVPFSFF